MGSARDWAEGRYMNVCVGCGETFLGQKRQHLCWICFHPDVAERAAIYEFDAGMTREHAENAARSHGDAPGAILGDAVDGIA